MSKIVLQPKRERSVLLRHPWIFSGGVRSVEGSPAPGATVTVESARGEKLGWGSYSPASQIRVRMLSFDPAAPADEAFVCGRVKASVARRASFFADETVTGFRLVHGESDGLPGVVADWYAGWIVVQLSTAGADFNRNAIAAALMETPGAQGVYERSDVDGRAREGLEPRTGLLAGAEPPEKIEIRERNICYLVDVRRGHKTGFYLDQREARAAVGAYAKGKNVLNCFSYTGGFGLACRAGGAAHVENLDLSQPALDLARENFALTFGGDAVDVSYVCADVFKQLRLYRDQGKKFDLIVLDPPKFADTKAQLMRAARGYKDINLLAMKMLSPGGILATFSCSGAMTPEFFDTICAEAATDAKRSFLILERTRQGADHPVALSFPEGHYLKGLILRAAD